MLKTKLKNLMTLRKMKQHVVSEKNSREFRQPLKKKVIENGRKRMKESVKEKDSLKSIFRRRRKRRHNELQRI